MITLRNFIFKGNKTITSDDINLKDLPGSCGRLDLVCRCVSSSLFLSHGIRKDTNFYSIQCGPPNPPITIKFVGSELKRVSPDERSIALFIKKALGINPVNIWKKSTDGIYLSKMGFKEIINDMIKKGGKIYYLHKDGMPFERTVIEDDIKENDNLVFILGDHIGIGEEDEKFLDDLGIKKISISPLELHANHCITIVHNILDKHFYDTNNK